MTPDELYDLGQKSWPALVLERATFVSLLGAHDAEDLSNRNAGDLFLALACATGDAAAIGELEKGYMDAAVAAVRRMRGTVASAEEIAQVIRSHVLVADGDDPPRISRRLLTAIATSRKRSCAACRRSSSRSCAKPRSLATAVVMQPWFPSSSRPTTPARCVS